MGATIVKNTDAIDQRKITQVCCQRVGTAVLLTLVDSEENGLPLELRGQIAKDVAAWFFPEDGKS